MLPHKFLLEILVWTKIFTENEIKLLNNIRSQVDKYIFDNTAAAKWAGELCRKHKVTYCPIFENVFQNPILRKEFEKYGNFLESDKKPYAFLVKTSFSIVGHDNYAIRLNEGEIAVSNFSRETIESLSGYLCLEG